MELEASKLVVFALWAESNEGVTGKGPGEIKGTFEFYQEAKDIDGLRWCLGPERVYLLDNYLTVWEAAGESDKAFDALESASTEEQEETPAKEVERLTAALPPVPAKAQETSAEEVETLHTPQPFIGDGFDENAEKTRPQPKKQRGKRGKN